MVKPRALRLDPRNPSLTVMDAQRMEATFKQSGPQEYYPPVTLPKRTSAGHDAFDLFVTRDGNQLFLKKPTEQAEDGLSTFVGRLHLESLGLVDGYRRRKGKLDKVYVVRSDSYL